MGRKLARVANIVKCQAKGIRNSFAPKIETAWDGCKRLCRDRMALTGAIVVEPIPLRVDVFFSVILDKMLQPA